MFTTTLYLDFDGVVNAKHPTHELIAKFTIAIKDSLNLAPLNYITFSPTVVETIDRLREQYNVELVWLTTWNEKDDVLKLSKPLGGLHGGRVLLANLNQKSINKSEWTHWKAEAIIADQLTSPRPFVWIDDNAHQFHGEIVSAETQKVSSLMLTPVSRTGLTVENLTHVEDFLKRVS